MKICSITYKEIENNKIVKLTFAQYSPGTNFQDAPHTHDLITALAEKTSHPACLEGRNSHNLPFQRLILNCWGCRDLSMKFEIMLTLICVMVWLRGRV